MAADNWPPSYRPFADKALLDIALDMACRVLMPGGVFLAKCFRGGAEKDALDLMRRDFAVVRHVKPAASRAESVESYAGHRLSG